MRNVIVIGAGPAGLFAAETLAAGGVHVDVYDHKPSPARKFLMAGRGGLNITHSEDFENFVGRYGVAEKFLRPALEKYTPTEMRNWCIDLGEETFVGSSGRVFPKSFKATPLLRAWLARLETLGVTFHYHHDWRGWDQNGAAQFNTPDGPVTKSADATLLALGGASWPRLGSDGTWADTIQSRGVTVHAFAPSNCGFHVAWSDIFKNKFAGHPLKSITLTLGDKTVHSEAMITSNGIEGGGIYALSPAIRDALTVHTPVTVYIDLKPDMTMENLTAHLSKPSGRDSFTNYLRKASGLSPVAIGLLNEYRNARDMSPAQRANLIKKYPLNVTAPFSIDRAISSAGGIALGEINEYYMLNKAPGVFVAGEMLDWEAPTGGYLLQATFSTARAAANGIINFLGK